MTASLQEKQIPKKFYFVRCRTDYVLQHHYPVVSHMRNKIREYINTYIGNSAVCRMVYCYNTAVCNRKSIKYVSHVIVTLYEDKSRTNISAEYKLKIHHTHRYYRQDQKTAVKITAEIL